MLQKQEEVEDKSHNATTKGSPTSFTGRVVPHFPGEDFPDPLTAVSAIDVSAMSTMSASVVDDYNAATQASVCTLTPAAAGPVIEAHMMQLHAMRHYPLIDQHYFSQQEVGSPIFHFIFSFMYFGFTSSSFGHNCFIIHGGSDLNSCSKFRKYLPRKHFYQKSLILNTYVSNFCFTLNAKTAQATTMGRKFFLLGC